MKNQRKTEIKVGLTTIFGIIIFLWILGWAKNITFFSDEHQLQVKFQSVSGLEIGDRVTVNGLRKGSIEEIETYDNSVLVTAKLNSDVDLRKDANISIMMHDLMGAKKLEIFPGSSEELLDYSVIQQGKFVGDISSAMASFSEVQEDITDIILETKKTLISVNEFFSDENLRDEIKNTIYNLNDLTKKIYSIADDNSEGVKNLIVSGNKLAESANTLIIENDESIKLTISKIQEMIDNSNNLVLKMDNITSEIVARENNIGKLLYDEKLIEDLKISIGQIKELTKILIEQIKDDGMKVDANIF